MKAILCTTDIDANGERGGTEHTLNFYEFPDFVWRITSCENDKEQYLKKVTDMLREQCDKHIAIVQTQIVQTCGE